jgi:uncharacterized protein
VKTIGTEEHFVTEEVLTAWGRLDPGAREDSRASVPPGEIGERLREVAERRIAAMDEAGLDVQVLSLTRPACTAFRRLRAAACRLRQTTGLPSS